MRTIAIAAAFGTLTCAACTDTENEELAEADEERTAELRADLEGAGPLEEEVQGEIAERRGELARDVGADTDTMAAPTECDEVYEHVVALQTGADPLIGGDSEVPEEQPFLAVCEKLPEDVRPCMSVGYAYRHRRECEKALDDLPPGLRASLDQVASAN